jgi:hypothetical protein
MPAASLSALERFLADHWWGDLAPVGEDIFHIPASAR